MMLLLQLLWLAVPVIVFRYVNPVLRYGVDRFLRDAAAAGAAGLLLTDLPAGGDPAVEDAARRSPLDLIRLVAPTTTGPRLREVAGQADGFLYLVARLGVTGACADSYLDVDAVVDAANDLLTQAGSEGSQLHKKAVIYGLEYKVKRDFKRTKVWKRDLFFEGNGLHAEHAHNRYDAANHDGSTKGHGPTDLAAKYKWIGQFDSIRRETFVTGGAALYLETRAGVPVYQPFGVYAIGHTHVADLRPVLISHYADNGVQLYFPKSLSNPRAGRQMAKPKSSEIFDGLIGETAI